MPARGDASIGVAPAASAPECPAFLGPESRGNRELGMGPTGTSRLGPPSRVLIEPRGSSGEGVHAAASKERGGASEGGKPKSTAAEQQQAAGTPPPQGEAALREALSALPLEWLERAQAELESRVRLGSAGAGRE